MGQEKNGPSEARYPTYQKAAERLLLAGALKLTGTNNL